MANADNVERVFRSEILPELVALLEPRGFKARVSQHDFIRRVEHGSQQLVLLRDSYVGRQFDYIVDYGVRVQDQRVRAILRTWNVEERRLGFGLFMSGSGLHRDVVPSAALIHRIVDSRQATSTMSAVLVHLADRVDDAEANGYAEVFAGLAGIEFYAYLAADAARRGKKAEALAIVERLPRSLAAVRAAAVRDLS